VSHAPDENVCFSAVLFIRRYCVNVLNMNHLKSVVVTFVNFIRATAMNRRQFISLLQGLNAEHTQQSVGTYKSKY
jgi:hypothetical protein